MLHCNFRRPIKRPANGLCLRPVSDTGSLPKRMGGHFWLFARPLAADLPSEAIKVQAIDIAWPRFGDGNLDRPWIARCPRPGLDQHRTSSKAIKGASRIGPSGLTRMDPRPPPLWATELQLQGPECPVTKISDVSLTDVSLTHGRPTLPNLWSKTLAQ